MIHSAIPAVTGGPTAQRLGEGGHGNRPTLPAPPVAQRHHPQPERWEDVRQFIHELRHGLDAFCGELERYCLDTASFSPDVDEQTAAFRWRIATWLLYAVVGPPTRISLALPQTSMKGQIMPNFELNSDAVYTVSIQTTNATGTVEPAPPGDVFTVTSSNATSLAAVIGADAAGNPAVVLTPKVVASPNITITVSDSAGLAQFVQICDVVADVADSNILLDVAGATHVAQPVPTNPGP